MLFSCVDSGSIPLQTWLMCQTRQPTRQHHSPPGQPARPLGVCKARQHSIDQTRCALEPISMTYTASPWWQVPAACTAVCSCCSEAA